MPMTRPDLPRAELVLLPVAPAVQAHGSSPVSSGRPTSVRLATLVHAAGLIPRQDVEPDFRHDPAPELSRQTVSDARTA